MDRYCVVLFLVFCAVANSGGEIKVLPTDCSKVRFQNCTRLTEALQEIQSDTTLLLLPGDEHVLEKFVLVRDVRNVALVSGISQSNVTITCSEGVGLAFVNITNLTLQELTIRGCGLSGESLENATTVVNETVDMFLQVPTSLHVAVLLGSVSDANLVDITIRDVKGLGLLGVNLVGASSLADVTFANNRFQIDTCLLDVAQILKLMQQDYRGQIGGGAFLVYSDYLDNRTVAAELVIRQSRFLDNHDCSATGAFERRMQFSGVLCKEGYTVGAGGGLSVMISQKNFPVNVSMTSCSFQGNSARFGSGAHISHFVNAMDSRVVFDKCNFTDNGGETPTDGAGIAVLANVLRPSDCFSEGSYTGHFQNSIRVEVVESVFRNNIAFAGGGIFSLFIHSLADSFGNRGTLKLVSSNCTFENNSAIFGAAMYAYEHNVVTASSQSTPPGGLVEVSGIRARYNTLEGQIRSGRNSSGIIDIRYIHLVLNDITTLAYNRGTALRAKRSRVDISGNASFCYNVGSFGGAISLIDYSFLVIRPNTTVVFDNNHANYRGGVFHVFLEDEPDFLPLDCFLYWDSSDRYCFDSDGCVNLSSLAITIRFSGNTAAYGNIIYGSALETCPWGQGLMAASNYSGSLFTLLVNNEQTRNIFEFDTKEIGVENVTTPSSSLNIFETTDYEYTAMPGQNVNITLSATDRLGQLVAVTVTSVVLPPHPRDIDPGDYSPALSILGIGNYWVLRDNGSSRFPLRTLGQQKQQVRVAVFTTDATASQVIVTVNLTDCALGFQYSEEDLACVCTPELQEHGIVCSLDAQLIVPNSVWVGPVVVFHNRSSSSESVAVYSCVFDYCKLGETVIAAGDFDAQCAEGYNRGGLLCGACREGYSIVLGTKRCLQCINNTFLALIVAFMAAGVLLFIVVAFLKVSVSEGYLNGLLFYSHILSPFIFRLVPTAPVILLPVAFLNLDLGIETCFYNGMNALAYTGFQFLFPFYLYLLMGIVVLAARCIKCTPCHECFSTGKTFATLLVLSFPRILRTCIEVLRHVTLEAVPRLGVGSSVRWAVDPSVHFFRGWHAVLAILSILLLIVYVVLLPLVLLFPSKSYSFKYTGMMKPILDAFFAPYKRRFQSWLGIRLVVGISLSTASLYLSLAHTIFLTILVLVTLVFVQLLLKPYRGFCRNFSDGFLLANLIILFVGALMINEQYGYETEVIVQERQTIFSAAVVSVAYIVFLGVLLYHIFLRLPQSAQEKLIDKSKQTRFTKEILDFFQALITSENDVSSPTVCDGEPTGYIPFDDRDKDDDEETKFGNSESVVEAPQYSEGLAEITPAYT